MGIFDLAYFDDFTNSLYIIVAVILVDTIQTISC